MWRAAENVAHLLRLSCTGSDPFLRLFPSLVKREQARLATTLDQLVRLRNELGCEHPVGELGIGGNGVRFGVPGDLSNLWHGESEVGGNFGRGIYSRSALKPIFQE